MKQLVIILFVVVLMNCSSCNSCESWVREHETNNSFSGEVVGKYMDTVFGGRNQARIVLQNTASYKENTYSLQNGPIYNSIDSGDFIYKDSGSLKRYLIKKNDTIIFYPQCGDGNDIK